MKKIIALILVIVMAAVPLMACNNNDEGEIMGDDNPYKASDIVLKSENFSYTRAELSIAFHQYYMDFSYDNENIDFYNIDTEASLKDQIYYDDVTWFDYFADMSVAYMKDVLLLCEAAKANGIELTEEDLESIEDALDSFVRYANDYGYSEEEYFTLAFGSDADQDALREYYKKEALAIKYEESVIGGYSFTDDELLSFAKKNEKQYYTIDYISYTFDEDNDKDAKAAAEALAKITDAAAFDAYILSYMTDTLALEVERRTTKDCYYSYKYYDEYSEFSKWAFDGKKAGETYIKSNEVDGQYTVYLLTKAPDIRDDITKDICMITVDIDSHDSTAKAMSYAEELIEEWKKGEATEESFSELAKKHSDDTAAKTDGGYERGIARGESLPEGFEEWLYDSETAVGSTTVIKEPGYYYAVYYVGEGELKWKLDAKAGITNEKYLEHQEGIAKEHTIEEIEEVINSLDV